MAVVSAPGHRSLIGRAVAAFQARKRQPPLAGALAAKVREHVITVAALTVIDVGAFHVPAGWGAVAGWIVTGCSLLVFDFAVTGQ